MSISELYRISGSVSPVTSEKLSEASVKLKGVPSEFDVVLNKELHLSQHAETRIRSRALPWNAALQKRISDGIDVASSKGSREALILADNLAVIANVKSRTIITAMERDGMKGRIFTNIDSAVLV